MKTNENQNPTTTPATNNDGKQSLFIRDPGYGETTVKCVEHSEEFAVVYLVRSDGSMIPLGDIARREILASERALAEIENRDTRFINLVPVWCLNATSMIVNGKLVPETNRHGKNRDGQHCKICCVPGCNHPVGKKSVPFHGINYLFCGGCAAALTIEAKKVGKLHLVPIDANEGRAKVAVEREEIKVRREEKLLGKASKAALAVKLLGETCTAKIKDGKLVQTPFEAMMAKMQERKAAAQAEAKPVVETKSEAPKAKKARSIKDKVLASQRAAIVGEKKADETPAETEATAAPVTN